MAAKTEVQVIVDARDNASKVLKNVGSELKQVSKEAGSTSDVMNTLSNAFNEAAKGSKLVATGLAAVGSAAIAAAGFGVKIAGDLESAEKGFVALLGSADEAGQVMERIFEEARTTPFEIQGLVRGTQALTAITKDGNRAIDILLDVGKAVAISGKGSAELDRVIFNLQQIAASGKVTAMDIRQFQSAIPIFNDIIEAQGLTVEGLKESSTAAEDLFAAFKKAGEEGGIAAAGFSEQAGTFNQLISNMKDNVTILASEIVKQTGIFDATKESLAALNQAFDDFSPQLIQGIKDFFSFIQDNGALVAGMLAGALAPSMIVLGKAIMTSVVIPLAALAPWIAAGGIIAVGIQKLIEHLGGWEEAQNKVAEGIVFLQGKFGPFVQALEGIWNRIKPIKDALVPLFQHMKLQFETTMQVIHTQVKPAFDALIEVMKPFIEALLPMLAGWLKLAATAFGVLLAVALAFLTGIMSAIANALPYIAQAVEGIIQFFRGLIQFLTGVFTGDFGLVVEGVKQMLKGLFDFWTNTQEAIIKAVSGFIKGVIAFFTGLYNALIGNSIVPDLVNGILSAFQYLKDQTIGKVIALKDSVIEAFNAIHDKVMGVIDSIRSTIDNFKPRLKIGLDLPNLDQAWSDLKGRASELGIPGFQTGGVVPGPVGAPVPVIAHGGETINPIGVASGGGGGQSITFEVNIGMYAGGEVEKRNVARELYSALGRVAKSQNKTVQEFMGV